MSDELTEINGIGDAMVDRMESNGFVTPMDLAKATTDEIAEVQGVGSTTAEDLKRSALEAVEDDDSDSGVEEADADTTDDESGETDTQSEDEIPGFEVTFSCSSDLYPHILAGVVDEIRDGEQSNNQNRIGHATSVFEALVDVGPDGAVTLVLEMDELTAFRRGVKNRARRYRQTGTLPDLGSELANLSAHLQDIRNDHWGE